MSSAHPLFHVNATLGAMSIGCGVSCVFFGVFLSQVFAYYRCYPSDRPVYKLLVAVLLILEAVDQFLIGYSVYFYTILNYSSPFAFLNLPLIWTLLAHVASGTIVGAIVKMCFAMRVWRFSKNNIVITAGIVLLTFVQLGLGIVYTVKAFQYDHITDFAKLQVVASLSLGSGVVTDIAIAISLCYFLRKLKSGYKGSDSMVYRLTFYAVETGVITSAISICTLVLYDISPEKLIFMAFYFGLSKVYAMSLLVALNTRQTGTGRGTDHECGRSNTTEAFYMVGSAHTEPPRGDDQTKMSHSPVQIGIHQEVSIIPDFANYRQIKSAKW